MSQPKSYTVTLTVDFEATSFEDAAEQFGQYLKASPSVEVCVEDFTAKLGDWVDVTL